MEIVILHTFHQCHPRSLYLYWRAVCRTRKTSIDLTCTHEQQSVSTCKRNMSLTARSHQSRRIASCHLPLYDFLAPFLTQTGRPIRCIRYISATRRGQSATAATHGPDSTTNCEYPPPEQPTRTPKSDPGAASRPAPMHKPLTQAQRDFLTAAVSSSTPRALVKATNINTHPSPAKSQPSRRARRNPNIHLSNTSNRKFTSKPPPPNETHV